MTSMIMRFSIFAGLAVALLAGGLAGCATQKKVWSKPGLTQDQWAADSAECRSRARRLAEDEYTRLPGAEQGGVNQGSGFDSLMRRHEAKRGTEDFYRNCLARKGYRLITPPPAPTAGTKT